MKQSDPSVPPAGDDNQPPEMRRLRRSPARRPEESVVRSPDRLHRRKRARQLLLRPSRGSFRRIENVLSPQREQRRRQLRSAAGGDRGRGEAAPRDRDRDVRGESLEGSDLNPFRVGEETGRRGLGIVRDAVPDVDGGVVAGGDDMLPVSGERRRDLVSRVSRSYKIKKKNTFSKFCMR